MLLRPASLALIQVLMAGLAWWQFPPPGNAWWALAAAVLGGYIWLVLDAWRGLSLLRWLKAPDMAEAPVRAGLWGEVFERVRKLLRQQQRLTVESDVRLHDFLAAMQASPNGVTLLDSNGQIEWFNQTAANHFGLDPQRDLLQHFVNLVRVPEFASYYQKRDFQNGIEMPGREHTSARPVKLSVHMHPYGEGRHLVLSRDITALEQAEAMRRDFVANVSHEIRTPLTVLGGFVETLQTLPLDEAERGRYLGLMAQQADRMQTLVNDLLMLSRLEGSPLPAHNEWVPLRPLLQRCLRDAEDLSQILWHQPREIAFDAPDGIEVAGSPTELQSAFANLMGNAVRYSPADRPVQVQCVLDALGAMTFSVQDSGAGIAPEHLPRLTERFYRVDRSRSRETGGTGLGLAIVKHVAQRHGAELRIESQVGQGSRFSLSFPSTRIRVTSSVSADGR